jgi:hypothetical protein
VVAAISSTITSWLVSGRPRQFMEMIPLTRNELGHLFAALVAVGGTELGHRLHWSLWRRRHQARARTSTTDGKPPKTP